MRFSWGQPAPPHRGPLRRARTRHAVALAAAHVVAAQVEIESKAEAKLKAVHQIIVSSA
jgi:hypothetical protein